MFQGTIPQELRSLIHSHANGWDCSDVYIGSSGNYTIERTLAEMGKFVLHGNDVQIYSCMIGAYLSNAPPEMELNPDYEESLGWLREYMKTPPDKIATLMICSDMLAGLDKHNAFYDRLFSAYKSQFPILHEKTKAKIEKLTLRLKSFFPGDVFEYLDTIPANQGFMSFPPFYAKGYEVMFKNIEKAFIWNKPSYTIFDDERMAALKQKIISKKYWLFGTRFEQDDLSNNLCGKIKRTNRAMPIFVYASTEKKSLVAPHQKTQPCTIPRITEDEDLGDCMALVVLNPAVFNALRSKYMNGHIPPATPSLSVGVTVGGKLIGVYAFSTAPTPTNWGAHIHGPTIYLMTDFSVCPTKYKRLSKLVLYACVSRESKILAERCANRRQNSVVTTAFANKPISMKYRGLFRLLTKKDHGEGCDCDFRFELNYGSPLGLWSLDTALATWKGKYGKEIA